MNGSLSMILGLVEKIRELTGRCFGYSSLPANSRERERERERRGLRPFFLKMDIKSFFTSIDQKVLYDLIGKKIKNKEILWLTKTIIFHDCAHDIPPKIQSQTSLFDKLPRDKSLFTVARGKGLPIGNLTSQFFANVYMNELDQFAKHQLKAKYYLRYVDDFLILSSDRDYLEHCRDQLTDFALNKLKLKVHPDKQFIKAVSCGIDFVGYIVRPEYVLVRKRIIADCKFKLGSVKADSDKYKEIVNSYRAHFMWANTFSLQKKIFDIP